MSVKTYTVGNNSGVRRLDNLSGSWIDVSLNLAPFGAPINVILRDVMTDPLDSNKVFAVGGRDRVQGAYGIYVSNDGGIIWYQPGGDITSVSYDFSTFWEVWVVDSNTIYACADGGLVFKSTDGGATFNKTTTVPTSDGNPSATIQIQSIHFISATTGIVGLSIFGGTLPEIWKTTDGGGTWIRLNGNAPLSGVIDTDEIWGIHLSSNEQTINALGDSKHVVSTDGGASFVSKINFITSGAGRHLTWRSDLLLWIMGAGGYRSKSIDGGITWVNINPYFGLNPTHKAAHLFTDTDGFYSEDFDVLFSGDGLTTGALSETSPYGIEAVWTTDDNPPEEPCGCPEGTIYNEESQQCEGFEITPASVSGTTYLVEEGDQSTSYGWGGTNFYGNVDNLPWPIGSSGGVMEDSSNTPVPIQQNVNNSIWGNITSANALTTILNTSGVWSSAAAANEWIGFTTCVNAPETKVYYVGLAADNLARFKVNGQLVVEFEGCTNTFNFNYWHVFPITLQAGDNIIEMEGRNCGSVAAFAAEIYDATLADLTTMTLQAQLNAVKIFTTANQVGTNFHTGENSGYSCPPGWALSLCDGSFTCARTFTAPFIPCNCYLATDCEDPTVIMLITTNDELDLDLIYNFEGFDNCWTVVVSEECAFDAEVIGVVESHVDCQYCLGLCYILSDCSGEEADIKVDNDFSAYVGQVITLKSCPHVCWEVSEAPDCEGAITVSFKEVFADCDTCDPVEEEDNTIVLKPRRVEPGYNPPACDPDYYEKILCNLSEAVFQKVASDKYGIQFCCETNLQKYRIKYELLKLRAIYDPYTCITCCEPGRY